ncbi:ABC transporter ATP-binding protein [Dictyobacter aurantiacus]|uniref:Nitrate/sulfonate/bicarbonate ABC transporter ATP-binding protein n=1 Tax=Dictyobacter aurantiacus TaxID=1936993 RepID=A0A401ZJ53_9CHLR|nr:ABC transporter ATP-binding protein [Dictyobacter aurantiacus]GCE06872.1 nitrate/sulfonate/bicarbonate ABC transporter ATP-binding protein [Dictyobacter aurantiacus]
MSQSIVHIQSSIATSSRDEASPLAGGNSLRISGVSKTFVDGERVVEALRPVDLAIQPGEFVCFLGPSGCGKSTLLNIIAGLEQANSGTIFANDKEIRGTGTDRILLFQEAALFPWLNVQQNVEFGLRQARMPRRQRAEVARHYLNMVGLSGFEHSYPHQLSGGMRQRAAIARALAIDPEILLMDEPFGALDAFTRDKLHAQVETIWRETRKTVLFVTHNVREAVALGDRVIVFAPRPGRIIRDFPIELPRPRSLEDYQLVDQAAEILEVLRGEMQKQEQEDEFGSLIH